MEEKAVALADSFSLQPQSFEQLMTFAEMVAKSGLAPKDYKGEPGNVMIAVQMGIEVGLKPMQAIQNIAVINGRPSLWGDALIALVKSSGICEYIKETFDKSTMTATCVTKRKGDDEVERTFSEEQARTAGLWDKAGPWKNYPHRMMQMRARAFCLRDVYPDVLKGLHSAEEQQDTVTVVSTDNTKPKKLTEVLTEDAVIDDGDEDIESMVKGKPEEEAKPEPEIPLENQLCTHAKWMDIVDYFETYPENLKLVKKETIPDLGAIDVKHFDWVWKVINEWADKANKKKA